MRKKLHFHYLSFPHRFPPFPSILTFPICTFCIESGDWVVQLDYWRDGSYWQRLQLLYYTLTGSISGISIYISIYLSIYLSISIQSELWCVQQYSRAWVLQLCRMLCPCLLLLQVRDGVKRLRTGGRLPPLPPPLRPYQQKTFFLHLHNTSTPVYSYIHKSIKSTRLFYYHGKDSTLLIIIQY